MAPTSSVCSAAPDSASHSRTVLSHDADTSVLPSGEKAMARTSPEWPSSVCSRTVASLLLRGFAS
ncbi:hypothetical protein P152DRAFT_326983 [Eremomyces bilateralis CBS 781.70]|uniref:Uncharacterized protein n=1 Tax=Eremomyces bilateralis CBS 781.70 TaxID=1392243 RepID=A0A6G1G4I3_9PEZI|nr:uncharacterized protein P152DRAFT_326983 [Eremomyces bilateralis CBS 781.70]KAF1812820.1 hypothetical protein P152DRAFT_326983 [Eremomyces bilateralis CBS 781.70]